MCVLEGLAQLTDIYQIILICCNNDLLIYYYSKHNISLIIYVFTE